MAKHKTLFVSDFDDTLARTDATVYLTRASGEKIEMTPEKYATYEEQPGDQFDFSEFDRLINPRPIQRFTKLMQKAVHDKMADRVVVLTARGHTRPVSQFLKLIGITSGVTIAALGSSDPQRKARYIEKQIQDGYDRVLFVDDSPKNVAAVQALQPKYPNAKIVTHQAKAHEEPKGTTPAEKPSDTTSKKPEDTESAAAKQAKQMGLSYMGFGRYGKDGKVTHTVQNDRLIQKQTS